MWHRTDVAKHLGIRYPIVQGPFGGGLSSTRLVAAVSGAGGLGSFGAENLPGFEIRDLVRELRSLVRHPFAVNLWIPTGAEEMPTSGEFESNLALLEDYYRQLGVPLPARPKFFGPSYHDQIEAIIESRPPVFSFVYGIPEAAILEECRRRSIRTIGTATTPEEAVALDRAGVDCIVASGAEAGGHKGAFLGAPERSLVGTFALVPQVVDQVRAPLIAAGGIADGRGIRAALALGAGGVQIGTAFLACEESGASDEYREMLFSERGKDTVLTRVFTGRLARSMRNRLSDELAAHESELPSYPVQSWLTGRLKASAIGQGRTDLMALWAGQAAPLVKFKSAVTLFASLVQDASC